MCHVFTYQNDKEKESDCKGVLGLLALAALPTTLAS
jgi:hypothetical protein